MRCYRSAKLPITVWRLAFVADFGTRNFNFKNKFDMENKSSTNNEKGNDANRLLPAVYPLIDNHRWYAENGTVYNEADEEVRIVLLHNSGSYLSLPHNISEMIASALNSR